MFDLVLVDHRAQDNRVLRVRRLSYDQQTLLDIFASQGSGANALERTFGLEEVLGAEAPRPTGRSPIAATWIAP